MFSLVNDRRSAIVKNSNCNFRQNYMVMRWELRGNLIEPLFRTKTWERAPSKRFYDTVHNGGICQFSFRWIHYCGSNNSTGQKSVKSQLCAMVCKQLGTLIYTRVQIYTAFHFSIKV